MSRPAKRARGNSGPFVVQMSAKRPIDKSLIYVSQSLNTTQQSTTLTTTTFPCTITGIRWSLAGQNTTTANQTVRWAIVLVKDGLSASTMAASDASDFYTPEQNVLAFGVFKMTDSDAGGGPSAYNFEGSTKTMRKMMAGDVLQLITDASSTAGNFEGVVQFFCKS